MTKAGFPITQQSLGSYFSTGALPRSEVLIGLRKVLGVSIDWLLTGEETEPTDVKQLNDILDHFAAKLGIKEQQLDPQIQRAVRIMLKLAPDQRLQLARIIDTYAKEDTM